MLTSPSPLPPPIKKQRATSTPIKYPVQQQQQQHHQQQQQQQYHQQQMYANTVVAPAPASTSSISSRRAALQAMQQRLAHTSSSVPTTTTNTMHHNQAPHTLSSNNILAMARSQLDNTNRPVTSTPLRSTASNTQIRSSSAGSLQRQQHQFSYNSHLRPTPPALSNRSAYSSNNVNRPMSSIMIENKNTLNTQQQQPKEDSNDDDSLLVTPPDYQQPSHIKASNSTSSSKKSNGHLYNKKSSPPPPPTPKELQKYYSSNSTATTTIKTPTTSTLSSTSNKPTTTSSSNNTNTLRLIQKLVEVTEEKTAAIQKASLLEQTLFEYQQKEQQNNKNNSAIVIQQQQQPQQEAQQMDTTKCMMHGAGIMKIIAIQNKMKYKQLNKHFKLWKDKYHHPSSSTNKDDSSIIKSKTDVIVSPPPPVLSVPATPSPPHPLQSSSSIKSSITTPPIANKYLLEALNTVSLDYTSDLASFTIRSPYKPSTSITHQTTTISSIDQYIQKATVLHPNTIELYIQVTSDSTSKFILHSHDTLYNISTKSNEVHPLGTVLYITSMGIEEEYNLQDIYNDAVIIRENYCTNILTAAFALQNSNENNSNCSVTTTRGFIRNQHHHEENDDSSTIATKDTFHNDYSKKQQQQYDSVSTMTEKRDVGIQTDTVLKEKEEVVLPNEAFEPSTTYFGKPTSALDEIASNFIFTTIAGFIFFLQILFFKLPKFIIRICKVLFIGLSIVGFVWWYFSNDYGAFNRRGYYYHYGGDGSSGIQLEQYWDIARNLN